METIYLAKWESRFWAWLIDILLVGALSDLIVDSSGFFWDFGFTDMTGFGVSGALIFLYWTLFEGYTAMALP